MRTNDKSQKRPIRVGLIGFGKAGQAVCAELLKAHDIDVIWVMRRQTGAGPDAAESVIGEFSPGARTPLLGMGLDEKEHINSVRVGGIVGRHEIVFGFPYQTLRLVHESISRNAFGQGALFALRALSGRAAGFYTMEQLVGEGFTSTVDA